MVENVVTFDFDDRNGEAGDLVDANLQLRKGASLRDGALRLDGRNDYALVAADAGLAVESGEIAFTFNADKVHGNRTIMSRDSKNFDGGGHLTIWIDDGKLKVRLQSDSESFTLETDAHAIRAHRDYDVVFGFGEDGMSLSINGEVVDTNAYTGGLTGNNEPLTLGASQMYSSDGTANHLRDYFDGEIKGFRMTQNTQDEGNSILIAHEDFENGADGWSNDRTGHSRKLGDYLGGFGGHETTQKCFDVPAGVEKLTITFDFLELDSWDCESFFVFVDGVKVDLGRFVVNRDEGARSGVSNGIEWSTESQGAPSELGGSNWHNRWSFDQVHKVTLTVPANLISGDKLTLKFDSTTNQSRHNESYGIDNLKIVGHLPDGDDCAVTETLLHEGFNDIHDPEDSANVAGHTDWDIKNGALFTSAHDDGVIAFRPVQLNGHVAGAFSFDIKANAVENFEASGHLADRLVVQLRVDGGHWITIDTLRRDGHSDEFVGDQSGFRFGDDGFTTLSYLNENLPGGSESVQFRLISHITAGDEKLFVDNVKITADKKECDDCDGVKIDFNDLAKGTIVSGQFEHVTISAKAFDAGKAYHLEAEHMHRDGFHKTHGDNASGGELVFASSGATAAHPATLSRHFNGHSSVYDVILFIQDENDGQSEVDVTIGGETRTITLDRDTNGSGSDDSGFTRFVLKDIAIDHGDSIKISSFRDSGERVRIDKLTFQEVSSSDNRAMIFDTDHITGGDHDLRNGDGKVLIISEDGDSSDPDDNFRGGEITFDFDPGVTVDVSSIVIVDTEEGGKVEAFGADGASLGVVDLPRIPDGAVRTVDLGFEGVAKLVVTLNGSGAIDDLCYEKVDAPQTGSLSGRYFCDTNDNDVDDGEATDPGIAGVVVTLFDAAGNEVARTTTGDEGLYSFTGLEAGVYSVRFTDPAGVLVGKQLVSPNVGGDDTVDSDAEGDTTLATIAGVEVRPGEETTDNDAGAEKTASLGDRVFLDDDRDGLQDAGEGGVAGVTVTLTGGGADGVIGTADDTTEVDVTDADGLYGFDGLNPGEEYKVTFSDLPAGFVFTQADQGGDDALDSDADPANGMTDIVKLAPGENNTTLDAGLVRLLGALSGKYFADVNRDGLDNDGDNGIGGILVELLDENGDPTGIAATTAPDGSYSFSGLVPGTYGVKFTDPDTGRELTTQNVDGDVSDDIDSDARDIGGGMSTITGITVVGGQTTRDNDAGVVTVNTAPIAANAAAMLCVGREGAINGQGALRAPTIVDLIASVTDADGDAVTIENIFVDANGDGDFDDAGEFAGVGQSIVTAQGLMVTLNADGTVALDGTDAAPDLLIRDTRADAFQYTASDGIDTATGGVDVTLKGDLNTLETVEEGLPTDALTFVLTNVANDAFGVTLGSSDERFDGLVIEDVYCLSINEPFLTGVSLTGTLTFADADSAPAGSIDQPGGPTGSGNTARDNLDLINWILNQEFDKQNSDTLGGPSEGRNYTQDEIQAAIWGLTDDNIFVGNTPPGVGTVENAIEIAVAALNNGEGFEVSEGDIIGLFLDPSQEAIDAGHAQPFIIGIRYDALLEDCLCIDDMMM